MTPSTAGQAGRVLALHRADGHQFSKTSVERVEVVAGVGVVGDAHAGATVRHRSRVRADPDQPNLRQVHLLAGELFDELASAGHTVAPGDLGENVTTTGVDLLGLPTGTVLSLGSEVLVALTGLRNPCGQIEGFQSGLLDRVRQRTTDGEVLRRAGVMAVVLRGGPLSAGDPIAVALPPPPRHPLVPV